MKNLASKKLNFLNSILFISFIYSCTVNGQNIVPNFSFEEIIDCPVSSGQFDKVISWFTPLSNGADYANACSSSNVCGVPTNSDGFSYQRPKSGNGYAGLFSINGVGNDFKQYVSIKLTNILSNNSCYFVSFYVSKIHWLSLSTNNMALNFSATIPSGTENILELEPHILKFNNPIITDTLNWVEISGLYTATGNEEYITIGNFKRDSETDTIVNHGPIPYYGAAYYIDDVSVIAVSDLPNGMPANAGLDKAIELGDSIFIGQEISNLNCTWRTLEGAFIADSISGIYVQATETTTYVVEQNLCGAITYDTVIVYVNPVGLKEPLASSASANGIVIFPNPNNGSFEIQNPTKQVLTFELKNALGQVVYQDKIITEKQSFELKLERGVYFAIFSNGNGVFEEKIVIK
jgi:hypothetical protein